MESVKSQQPERQQLASSLKQRVLQPYQAIAAQLQEIFSGGLLTTTLLLQFIWFTNALAYYGLVLLTTSVSHGLPTCLSGCLCVPACLFLVDCLCLSLWLVACLSVSPSICFTNALAYYRCC